MMDITEDVEVTVSVTPFNMGRAFAAMDSVEQASFFEGVAELAAKWELPAAVQWSNMRLAMNDNPAALRCFQEMAEFAED